MDVEAEPWDPRPRPAQADEAIAVAELWLRSRHTFAPANPSPVHSDDDVRDWFASVVLPERDVWVIDAGDALVALLVLKEAWIDQLHVDPAWTGQGLGSQLVDLAKRRLDRLDLWTFQSNVGARRFYERHGFVAVEMTDGDNEEGEPDVHYRWIGPER